MSDVKFSMRNYHLFFFAEYLLKLFLFWFLEIHVIGASLLFVSNTLSIQRLFPWQSGWLISCKECVFYWRSCFWKCSSFLAKNVIIFVSIFPCPLFDGEFYVYFPSSGCWYYAIWGTIYQDLSLIFGYLLSVKREKDKLKNICELFYVDYFQKKFDNFLSFFLRKNNRSFSFEYFFFNYINQTTESIILIECFVFFCKSQCCEEGEWWGGGGILKKLWSFFNWLIWNSYPVTYFGANQIDD